MRYLEFSKFSKMNIQTAKARDDASNEPQTPCIRSKVGKKGHPSARPTTPGQRGSFDGARKFVANDYVYLRGRLCVHSHCAVVVCAGYSLQKRAKLVCSTHKHVFPNPSPNARTTARGYNSDICALSNKRGPKRLRSKAFSQRNLHQQTENTLPSSLKLNKLLVTRKLTGEPH